MLNNTFAICAAALCSVVGYAQEATTLPPKAGLLRLPANIVVPSQETAPEAMRAAASLIQTPLGSFGLVRNSTPFQESLAGYVEGTVKTQDGGTARYLVNASLTDNDNTTSLSEALTVYPNPFSGSAKLTLKLPEGHYDGNDDNDREPYKLSIYNLAGERVKTLDVTMNGSKTEISLILNPGMYFLRLADSMGKPVGTGKAVVE